MKLRLLQLLQQRADHWVVMEALCHELSAQPQRISEAARALQEHGFQIEISPVSGYRYVLSEEPLWSELLKPLGCKHLGRRIEVVQTTASTSDLARAAAADRKNDGLVIFAEFQTAGRGRQGAYWISPAGTNLLFSILLFDHRKHFEPHLLTLASGIALAQAVKNSTALEAGLKWPNDLLLDSRKAGGILVEIFGEAVVIGMGLNCNCRREDFPDELKDSATSLCRMAGHIVDRHGLARAILERLDHWLDVCLADQRQQIRQAYLEHSDLLGRSVKISSQDRHYSGRVVDLDPFSGILVQLDHGGVRLFTPASTTILA